MSMAGPGSVPPGPLLLLGWLTRTGCFKSVISWLYCCSREERRWCSVSAFSDRSANKRSRGSGLSPESSAWLSPFSLGARRVRDRKVSKALGHGSISCISGSPRSEAEARGTAVSSTAPPAPLCSGAAALVGASRCPNARREGSVSRPHTCLIGKRFYTMLTL